MPRRAKADFGAAPLPLRRLHPPPHLTDAERAVFIDIVSTADARHFAPSDLPLVASYASAVVTEREALDHLHREGWVMPNGRPSGWVTVKEKAHRELIALSLRLRLSPQGRGIGHATKVKADRISAYEQLELEERHDGGDRDFGWEQ
jgi:hypothetical protein